HLAARAVARDAGGAGVNHVANAGHCEAGLGDVRGEHDAAHAGLTALKHAVLFGGGEATVQGQDLGAFGSSAAAAATSQATVQGVGGVSNLGLARQEDEYVARLFTRELVAGVADGIEEVAL